MTLDLSPLENAIFQLKKSLTFYDSAMAKKETELAEQFRSASIQAFEYTYELSWKMLKRYLELSGPAPETLDQLSFANLIRSGSEKNILRSDWRKWTDYRDARGTTSHTYNSTKAALVFSIIPDFLLEAEHLLGSLRSRIS